MALGKLIPCAPPYISSTFIPCLYSYHILIDSIVFVEHCTPMTKLKKILNNSLSFDKLGKLIPCAPPYISSTIPCLPHID